MNPNLSVFDFGLVAVRARMCPQRGALFAAVDVCNALALANPSQSVLGLDDDERITLRNNEGNPRNGVPHQQAWVTESGLYHLIFKSRKPAAAKFRRWVTSEVLPQLRKTGAYTVSTDPEPGSGMKSAAGRMLSFPQWLAELAPDGLELHFEAEIAQCLACVARETMWRGRAAGSCVSGFALIPEWLWSRAVRRWLVGSSGAGSLRYAQTLALARGRGLPVDAVSESVSETTNKEGLKS